MNTQTLRPHASTPLLVLGFGDFGLDMLQALGTLTPRRRLNPAPIVLWASPEGWSRFPAPVEAEVNQVGATLASGFNDLLGSTRDSYDAPQIILTVAMHEAAAWERTWQVVDELDGPPWTSAGAGFSLTLLVATDTAAYASTDAANQAGLRERLHTLETRVQQASERLGPGRIGWVYLLDSRDCLGRPVLDSAGPRPQAWLGAEFLALLAAGLGQTPEYRDTSLWHIARARRGDGRARVATLKAASFGVPLHVWTEQAARDVARTVVAAALGETSATSTLDARRRVDDWVTTCGLGRAALRRQLTPAFMTPVVAQPNTPGLAAPLTTDDLNQIEAWSHLLDAEWDHDHGLEARMEAQGRRVADHSRTRLLAYLTELETDLACGFPEAQTFLEEAQGRLLQARLERTLPTGRSRASWSDRLWNALGRAIERPGLPPNLELLLQDGRNWLRRQHQIRLSWRNTLLSVGIWVALGVAGLIWLGPVVLGVTILAPIFVLSLGVSTLLPWFLARVAAWIEQRLTEIALHHQIERKIHETREQFQIRLEHSLEQTTARVYADVAAELVRLKAALAHARAGLEAVQLDLPHLDDETCGTPTETRLKVDPAPDLHVPTPVRLKWPFVGVWGDTPGTNDLTQIRDLLLGQTRLLTAPLRSESLDVLEGHLVELAVRTAKSDQPAWPCSDFEVAASSARDTGVVMFLGLPSEFGERYRGRSALHADATFSTGEPGRSAYVLLVPALPLMTLSAWASIAVIARPQPRLIVGKGAHEAANTE